MEGELLRWHVEAAEPDVEDVNPEVFTQPAHEWLVIAAG